MRVHLDTHLQGLNVSEIQLDKQICNNSISKWARPRKSWSLKGIGSGGTSQFLIINNSEDKGKTHRPSQTSTGREEWPSAEMVLHRPKQMAGRHYKWPVGTKLSTPAECWQLSFLQPYPFQKGFNFVVLFIFTLICSKWKSFLPKISRLGLTTWTARKSLISRLSA